MFCKNCGTPLADGQRFCPVCGTTIQQPAVSAEPITSEFAQPDAFAEPVKQATEEYNGVPVANYVSNEFNQATVTPTASAEPYGAPVPPMAPPPAPKKSKKGFIIILSILIALIIAAGVCFFVFFDEIKGLFSDKNNTNINDETTSDVVNDGNYSSLSEAATNDLGSELSELIPQLPSGNTNDLSEQQAETSSGNTSSNLSNSNATQSSPSNSIQAPSSNGSPNATSVPSTSTQKYLNAEELARTTEVQQMMNAMNQSYASIGIRLEVSGVGNQLYYDCFFLQQVNASECKPSLDSSLVTNTAQFNSLVETFQESIIMPDFTMRVRYLNADGTIITQAVYPR